MFHFSVKNSLNCRETVQFVRIISTFTVLVTSVVICKFYARAFCSTMQTGKEENRINGRLRRYLAELLAACKPHIWKSTP